MTSALLLMGVFFFIAGMVQGTMGFGFGLTSMSLLALIIDLQTAVPVVAVFCLLVQLLLLRQLWSALSFKKLRLMILGAILGAFFIRLGESFVQGLIPGGWIFIQGGLFILVVTVLPEGVIGWLNNGGLRNLLTRLGFKRFIATYPSLEATKNKEI